MSRRPLPDWQYAHPDGRNDRIRELEAEVAMLRAEIVWYRAFYVAARARIRVLSPARRKPRP